MNRKYETRENKTNKRRTKSWQLMQLKTAAMVLLVGGVITSSLLSWAWSSLKPIYFWVVLMLVMEIIIYWCEKRLK